MIFPLITYPYLTRILGPERLGAIHFMDYAVGLIFSIGSVGIPAYGMYRIAQLQALGLSQRSAYRRLVLIQIVLCSTGYGIFYWFIKGESQWNFIQSLLPIGFLHILSNSATAEWFIQGKQRFDVSAIRNLILRVAGMSCIFWLVVQPSDYPLYYGIIVFSLLLTALFNFIWSKNDLRKNDGTTNPSYEFQWKDVAVFYAGTVLLGCTDLIDAVLLGILGNEEQVGYFGNSAKLIRLSLLLPLALNMVVSPQFSGSFAKKDDERSQNLLQRSVNGIIFLSLPICSLYWLYAEDLIGVFAGDSFQRSVPLMRWMSGIPFFVSISNLLLYYGLSGNSWKKKWLLALSVLAGISFSVALNCWLIPRYGAEGAAINSLITESGFMLLFMALIKPRIPWRILFGSSLSCLTFIPIYWMITEFQWESITRLITGGACSISLYLVIGKFLWKPAFLIDFWGSMRSNTIDKLT